MPATPSTPSSASARQRLDLALVERGLAESRAQAQALILAGEVRVDGVPTSRPGQSVAERQTVTVTAPPRFVSRGGEKLAHALDHFGIDPSGRVCADLGACTGGFTDCLLKAGATRVYAVDVGYGQLHWSLRQDARVVTMERTNVRYLTSLPEPIELITIDVSFISLRLVLPAARQLLAEAGAVITLIKPQFEAGRGQVGRGGVVRDRQVHRSVLETVVASARAEGMVLAGLTTSPLRGPAGNIEFLAWWDRRERSVAEADGYITACLAAGAELG